MNPVLHTFLAKASAVMVGEPAAPLETGVDRRNAAPAPGHLRDREPPPLFRDGPPPRVHVGVDLGTAYTVLVVLDQQNQPLAGEYRFAQIVRDGLVVDFHGAIDLLQELKRNVEKRLGLELTSAATTYPPGVSPNEVRATQHVVRAAGFECEQTVDEPTAANAVLQVRNGAVVDVGGGTTGIAVFREGEVIYTADEPTGGTHFSLVIAGALGIALEEAERIKKNAVHHQRLFPIVRPVMEKVGTIVARHVAAHAVDSIYLVGGTACFAGIDGVVQEVTGIRTVIPGFPLFVTPLGTAMYNLPDKNEVTYGR
ncbi:MAG TPA: ethanolamine utilization protein EutJ [Desulfobacterales bacterium]|jgi:ethanolamine utilization protein EutJ|nr:ethanolamine utilization protein EutJ [Desulfobacterales bacterium]